MDFETRDRYRHIIEEIAKKSGRSEGDIAQKAVELTIENRNSPDKKVRASHVGYYLIDEGRIDLESALAIHPSVLDQIKRSGYAHFFPQYFTGILLITLLVTYFGYTRFVLSPWFVVIPLLVLLLFPISQGAITVMNWFLTLLLTPVPLPKMDYSEGIPEDRRTIVVIPTVFAEPEDVTGLLTSIEIQYLANRDDNLFLALLTDLKNAPVQELPSDTLLVNLLADGIEDLNKRYQNEKPGTFFLMHRSRSWNAGEGVWMGYERKRGILEAFNRLLSGKGNTQFSRIVGNQEILTGIKYVITLDTDTELPRNSARRLIGAIAHPLNRPVSDPVTRVIREGYGILQPRVSLALLKKGISRFTVLFGGEQGIDPYTRAVSDVYQDAFREGSYIGKGIYDLEGFSQSVEKRFPESLILSHDLLEGCYARTGLVSDVPFFEEYPLSYLADIRRRHRWIRGDWQIVPWLFSFVPDLSLKKQRNPLSLLSRWKIFDNLRRSLVAPAVLLFILISWTFLADPLFWTTFIISLYLIPPVLATTWKVIRKPREQTWMLHLQDIARDVRGQLAVPCVTLIFLPYEAYNSLDAIIRSCWRRVVSHTYLLEWTTHQEAARAETSGITGSYRIMWPAPVLGAVILIGLILTHPYSFPIIFLFALAWTLSPAIAWWISQPVHIRMTTLTIEQKIFLRSIARKTWRFFETYVNSEDHYLPPDNYQEVPAQVVAHRTSPTDIGISLLGSLSAYDFGYIPASAVLERTEKTLATMGQLNRFRGHFYNWYDTITLEPLFPRYISTVDSGNLVGDLLVLKQGLNELPQTRVISHTFAEGLSDTLSILSEAIKAAAKLHTEVVSTDTLTKIADLKDIGTWMPGTTPEIGNFLSDLDTMGSEILTELKTHPDNEVRWWAAATKNQIENQFKSFKYFTSWIRAGNPPEIIWKEIPQESETLYNLYLPCNNQVKQRNPPPSERLQKY